MSKRLKIIILGLAAGLVFVIGVGIFAWYFFQQPLYQPGNIRAGENLQSPLTPPPQESDSDFWRVEEGIQLYHFASGEGRPVLIVHGGPGFPFLQPVEGLAPLTDRYRFHYYDQRGCGRSTRPINAFTGNNYLANMTTLDKNLGISVQLADIERIRHLLGEEQIILIGHSFGGFLAALYAAEFPDHVAGLVLVTPADLLVMPQARDDFFSLIRQRLPEEERNAYDDFVADYLDFGSIFSLTDAELAARNRALAVYFESVEVADFPPQGEAGGWMVQGMYISMGLRHDFRDGLAAIRAPVLVIHGTNDLQPQVASQQYVDAVADGRLVTIDTGHFPFTERPEEFAQMVGDFLDSLP